MAVVRLIFRPCVGNHPMAPERMSFRFVARNHPMAPERMSFRFVARNHPTGVRFAARNHPSVCVADSSPLGEPSINLGSILAPLEGSSGESR